MRANATRNGSPLLSTLILLLDIAAVWISAFTAARWRFGTEDLDGNYATLVLATSLMVAGCSSAVYKSFRGGSWLAMLGRVKLTWLVSCGLLVAWLFFSKSADAYSRLFIGTWMLLMLISLVLERSLVLLGMRWLSKKGYNTKDVLLVGTGPMSADLKRRAKRSSWSGYQIRRVVNAHSLDLVEKLAADNDFDEVWINLGVNDTALIPKVLHALRYSAADIRVVPDMLTYKIMNHGITFIMGMPMLDISASSLGGTNKLIKRIEDYLLASLILILISPVLLGIAIAVKITSPGPVFFRQRRHGWNGEEIKVYKFRSMKVHSEDKNIVTQAQKNDSRFTPIGPFLRRTSLDELPQFINVLQGRMSVVGPRPHAVQHNHHYKELIPRYMLRHKMKPGITGWAQINGLRGETDTLDKMEARVNYDLHYLENWSLYLDLKIVFLTVFKGFINKNAY
ncbi:undecaprenyl-phosphate glucose phosphotransferase [Iodobacter fluviatilis]|uniref:Colanic acid biosynthesis UDP-glucose lipid carrier transferase n=1 Tax=Iodobacter fluviatilis TaxID=537 RepID=A0A377Q7U7_9NEIS|nr:undecaprenyl-phosphate glucose phosphotransferase [Iodobacter fluviatilis]TCU81509.1 putative colanic acid biosynthesis UDP-glucose lipid carrier transferase [Iodobacter fluviatilis]STQ89921.1 Putative colanic biosynthesis UDP-glucose lipid carrier transferase [Iodobacter fluviatilis]